MWSGKIPGYEAHIKTAAVPLALRTETTAIVAIAKKKSLDSDITHETRRYHRQPASERELSSKRCWPA